MKSGKAEKTTSYMMAVPVKDSDIEVPQLVYDRISASEEFELLEISFNDYFMCPMVRVKYRDTEFNVDLKIETISIPDDFMLAHPLSVDSMKAMKKAKIGLTTAITFSDDVCASYHMQLKLLECVLPQKAAVVDFNTHKILSPEWVRGAAAAKTAPGPSYLFSVNVMPYKNDICWVYTFGLNRCGIVELEALDVQKEDADFCASLISLASLKAVCGNDIPEEMKPYEIATDGNTGKKVFVAWKFWLDAMGEYPEDTPGTGNTRPRERLFHNGVILLYPDGDTEKEPVKLNEAAQFDLSKLMVEFPAKEMIRQQELAQETIRYFAKALAAPEAQGVVKIRLGSSADTEDEMNFEFIWAKVDHITEDTVYCTSLNSSVFSDEVTTGEKVSADIASIADWVVNVKGNRIAPDMAFAL